MKYCPHPVKSVCLLLLLFSAAGCLSTREEMLQPINDDIARRTGYQVQSAESIAADRSAADLFIHRMLSDGLKVEEAVLIALVNNPELKARYEELRIAQADILDAVLPPNPSLEVLYQEIRHNGRIWELGVMQDIVGLLTIPARKKFEEYQYREEQARVTGDIMDLIRRVKTAFFQVQSDQQVHDMLVDILLATESSYEMAQKLREAGNITKLELVSRRAVYEETKLAVANAEMQLIVSREKLNRCLGLWGEDITWELNERLRPLPNSDDNLLTDVEKHAVETSLALDIYQARFEAAGGELGVQRVKAILPELRAGAEAERGPEGVWAVGPRIEYKVPLFNWHQAEREQAKARMRRAYYHFTATAIDVRSAARQARQRLIIARGQANYYEKVLLPLYDIIMDRTHLQYNAMQVGPFILLQTKQRQINVQRAYINALRDYWVARTELEQIRSGRLVLDSAAMVAAGGAPAGGMSGGGH